FVARLGPDGAPLWGRSYPEAAAQLGVAIAATDDGAVLLAGRHGGAVDLGGGPLAGDHFVARLDGDGAHLWSLGLDAVISDLAALPGGDVVLGGQFSGALDLGGGPLMTTSPQAIFVARLDAAGQQVWSRAFEDNGNYPHLLDLAAAPEGDALAVGFFRKEIAFGGPALVNKTQVEHVFAVRLDGDGGHRWSREFGSFVDQTAEAPPRAAIAAAPGGATAFVADFLGEVDLGGGPEESVSDSRDIFVGLYDPQGEHLWSRRYGGPLFNQARGVATDEGGHVVLTGQSRGLLDFGGEPLENRGPADMFVAELDPG
ncbi:MAG: hypothetical protein KC636_39890, partial [Myxococcales bacterium]|nr:hypothetical protein [Myxococcales bacterium]